MTVLRNGDWSLKATTQEIPKDAVVCKHNGIYRFATGEATNHHHELVIDTPEDMQVYKLVDGSYMVITTKEVRITHPEHSMITDLILPPGRHKLFQKREKDWFQLCTRKVVD